MPELAQNVVIDHDAKTLTIDGREFPWHISDRGPRHTPGNDVNPEQITVTFYAENASVIGKPGASPEPEMYPLTDYPTHEETFADFAAIRTQLDGLPESLNFIVSWWIYDDQSADFRKYDADEQPQFDLLVFLPRKTATSVFRTHRFDRAEVEAWLSGPVRERTMRWFGWAPAHA